MGGSPCSLLPWPHHSLLSFNPTATHLLHQPRILVQVAVGQVEHGVARQACGSSGGRAWMQK